MLLTRRSTGGGGAASPLPARSSTASRAAVSRAIPTMDRRTFLRRSGLGVGVGLAARQLTLVRKAQRADQPAAAGGNVKVEVKRTVCAPLLGGLRDRCRGRERRVDAAGAGVRLADQPGLALRQGCFGARQRARRVPPQVPDEAGQRQVPAHHRGTRRSTRSAPGCSSCARKAARISIFVVGSSKQQQRAGLPAQKVDVPLGQ